MMIIRYVKFLQSLTRSPKMCVQLLLQKVLRNINTITGKNVEYIQYILTVKPNILKCDIKFCEIKTEDKQRAEFIREMTNIKQNVVTLDEEGCQGAFQRFLGENNSFCFVLEGSG